MSKRVLKSRWGMMGIVGLMAVGLMMGCDRSEPPPPAKTSAPAAAPQTAQPQPPAPAPAATPAPVPAQTQQIQPPAASSQPMPVQPQQSAPAPAPLQSAFQENFSQVQIGMTSQQVLELLGNPTKMKQKHQEVEWEYYTPQGKFEIEFQMDKVVKIERH